MGDEHEGGKSLKGTRTTLIISKLLEKCMTTDTVNVDKSNLYEIA